MRGEDSIWNIHTGKSPHAWGRQGCTSLTKAPAGTSPRAWGRLFELRGTSPRSWGRLPLSQARAQEHPHMRGEDAMTCWATAQEHTHMRVEDTTTALCKEHPHMRGEDYLSGFVVVHVGTSPHTWGRQRLYISNKST